MKRVLSKILLYLFPSLGDILWIGVFAGVIELGPRMMNIDGDLGRHLTIGRYILDHGRIPTADLFSHTLLGQTVTPHEWLSQVIFALAERWLGLDGVVLVSGLVIAASFWLVYRRARSLSGQVLVSVFFTVTAIAASSLHWLTRPHIFTFLFLALWWQVLEDLRGGRLKRWILLPVLMLVWANLHGAFIAGFVTWGLYGLGLVWDTLWQRFPSGEELPPRFWRWFLLGGLASFMVTLANPSGVGLWTTSVGYVGNSYLVGHTAEYLPPNFHSPSTWPFLVMIGLLAVGFGLQTKSLAAARVIPVSAWLVMALYSTRNVPLFALLVAPLLAGAFGDWLACAPARLKLLTRFYQADQRLLETERSLRGMVWPALLVILAAVSFNSGAKLDFQHSGNAFDPQVFPVQAADWLAEHPQQGGMFNHFPWGGYLLYRMWPDQQVFIDGQTDFYGADLTRQYEQVLTLSPGWESVLQQYEVRWVVISPDSELAQELGSRAEWNNVYQDDTAVILVRSSP